MVDYTKNKFEEVYANDPFDVVLDLVGGLSLLTRFPQCACLELSHRRMTNALLCIAVHVNFLTHTSSLPPL